MGKGSNKRPTLISKEENELRWKRAFGEIDLTEEEFNKKINKIRKKTGKPF